MAKKKTKAQKPKLDVPVSPIKKTLAARAKAEAASIKKAKAASKKAGVSYGEAQ